MASRLAVAAVVLLVVVAGADALRNRGGGESPASPPVETQRARISIVVTQGPWCRRDRSRSVVVVRCNNWKGYRTDQIEVSGSSRELGPR